MELVKWNRSSFSHFALLYLRRLHYTAARAALSVQRGTIPQLPADSRRRTLKLRRWTKLRPSGRRRSQSHDQSVNWRVGGDSKAPRHASSSHFYFPFFPFIQWKHRLVFLPVTFILLTPIVCVWDFTVFSDPPVKLGVGGNREEN